MGRRGGAALAVVLLVGGCSSNVLHGIDERAANEAVSALERAGIGAEKLPDEAPAGPAAAFTVRVARADGGRALDLLRALGLPRERRHGVAETYGQPSLIPSPSEEHARYIDALAGEIERTLEGVDGVVNARVHLVLAESDPLAAELNALAPAAAGKAQSGARAAVLLKTRAGATPLADRDVQRLVAGSVPGLEPAAVAVVTTAAADAAEAQPPLAAIGPLRVSAGSRPLLVAALAIALAVLAVLAALLLWTARRLAALERAQQTRAP